MFRAALGAASLGTLLLFAPSATANTYPCFTCDYQGCRVTNCELVVVIAQLCETAGLNCPIDVA